MIDTTIFVSLFLFGIGLMINMPRAWAFIRSVRGRARWAALAWALMFVALGVFFGREDNVLGIGSMDRSAWFQVVCIGLAGAILLVLAFDQRVIANLWRLPIVLLATYGALGIFSAAYSPAPAISAYKGSLILMDSLLVAASIAAFGRSGDAKAVLNLSYFLATLFAAGALVGAVLDPTTAFGPSEGVLGVILYGTYPHMNPNTLGFLGAIISIVAFNRFTQKGSFATRFYWASQLGVGLLVLFLSQARTSLLSFIICFFFMSLSIPGKRWIASLAGLVIMVAVAYSAITGSLPNNWSGELLETAAQYAERGQRNSGLQTLKDRASVWFTAGIDMIRDRPLLGHGYDTGVRYGAQKYGLANTHMHNAHFQVLANSGVLGYSIWSLMVASVGYPVIRRLMRDHWPARTEDDRFFLEMFAVLLVVLLRTVTGQVLVAHLWSLMLFLGMVVYLYLERRNATAEPRSRTTQAARGQVTGIRARTT